METVRQIEPHYIHYEVPLVASTSMDWFLSKERGGSKGLQASRKDIRNVLGLSRSQYLIAKHSLGRYGTFQLEAPSVLMCLLADVRWRGSYTNVIGKTFAEAGLPTLIQSETFVALTEMVVAAVRALVEKGGPSGGLVSTVNRTIYGLAGVDLFREVAKEYSQIVRGVVGTLPSVVRRTGHVVWIDGRDALVAFDDAEKEEMRMVNAEYLTSFGIEDDGQALVAIDQQWSPDMSTTSYYQPAILEGGEDPTELARREKFLREHETPPPRD